MLHEKTTWKLTLDPGSIETLFHDCRSFSSFWRPAGNSHVLTFWREITTVKQKHVNNHFIINVLKYLSLPGFNILTSSKFLHSFLQNSARRQNSSGNTKETSLYCIYIQYLIAAPDKPSRLMKDSIVTDRKSCELSNMWFTETKPTQ